MDLSKLLHVFVALCLNVQNEMQKTTVENSNHLLSEHFQCVELISTNLFIALCNCSNQHYPLSANIIQLQHRSAELVMTSFRFLKQINHLPSQIDECVDRIGFGNGSNFFYNWSEIKLWRR